MALRYAIIGSGAIGGYYGGMLANAGKEVHFLFHSDYGYVKENGLKIDSVNGNFHLFPINAYNDTMQMPECDVVLVGLKTMNNSLLKKLLPPVLHKNSLVILIQNGLGVEAGLQEDFPEVNIAGGMAFICSNKTGKGKISHLAYGKISMGLHSADGSNILSQVCSDFTESGITAEIVELEMARWKKLVWNIPYNGMTVVLNTTTRNLMQNPATRRLIYSMMREVIRAANTVGKGKFAIPENFADEMMDMTDNMVPYSPSMKLDYDAKREMEIRYIYSNPVEVAQNYGFKMFYTSMLEKQLRFLQSGYIHL